ncbi:MAG TPA: hypothetical protein VFO85_22985, partial [Vicinamibacteria bacterium]|nr:hypothetical protein [Vicinamibacteria bacterium]
LRRREPQLARPSRAFGYPVLPALYVLVSLFFLYFILDGDPQNSGLGLLLTAAGAVVYFVMRSRRPAPDPALQV